jgi:hypothetical protein
MTNNKDGFHHIIDSRVERKNIFKSDDDKNKLHLI